MTLRVYILLFFMSTAYSCSTHKTNAQNESTDFEGTYIVNALYGQPVEGDDLNLKINERISKISGFAGCNTYSVGYTKDKNTLTFSHAISTKVYCEGEAMEKERQFLNIFTTTKEFSIKKDTLVLYDDGKEILKATRFTF